MYIPGNNYGLIQLLITRISREFVTVAGVPPKVWTKRLPAVAFLLGVVSDMEEVELLTFGWWAV